MQVQILATPTNERIGQMSKVEKYPHIPGATMRIFYKDKDRPRVRATDGSYYLVNDLSIVPVNPINIYFGMLHMQDANTGNCMSVPLDAIALISYPSAFEDKDNLSPIVKD